MSDPILIPVSQTPSHSVAQSNAAIPSQPSPSLSLLDRLSNTLNSLSLTDLEKVAQLTIDRVSNLKREEEARKMEELKRRETIETDEILKLSDKLIHALKNRKSEIEIPELQELSEILSGYRFSSSSSRYNLYGGSSYLKDRESREKEFNSARERASKFVSMNANRR
jgi:hypothetical protein